MRFESPGRDSVPDTAFEHPAFAGLPQARLLRGPAWPHLDVLNTALNGARHLYSDRPLRFAAQSPALLADGLHYEARIYDHGLIATREANWHDLFNALMWIGRLPLKCAINSAYRQEFRTTGSPQRSRRQYALTHFDEAGAVVAIRDRGLLDAWDRHDWQALLWDLRARWQTGARILLFGHALLEHFLVPALLPVAKCVVVCDTGGDDAALMEQVATSIMRNALLQDPQALRPLPLAGLPGWHPDTVERSFYRRAPCFRPLRPGRCYPAPA